MIWIAGREYGTAAEVAAALSSPERPVTAVLVRRWAQRAATPGDRLYGLLTRRHVPGPRTGTTWYDVDQAAEVEALVRPHASSLT